MRFVGICFFFECYGDHRDLHVLTHSFPTRRSSDLPARNACASLVDHWDPRHEESAGTYHARGGRQSDAPTGARARASGGRIALVHAVYEGGRGDGAVCLAAEVIDLCPREASVEPDTHPTAMSDAGREEQHVRVCLAEFFLSRKSVM